MSFQSVTVLGNVGKDPEIRTTQGGTKVASFSIAVSKKRQGEETTVWFNCIAFAKTADVVENFVRKGGKVLVLGEIATRQYEKDGATRYVWEVTVDRLSLESPKEGGHSAASQGGANTGYSGGDLDDEIPFSMEWR